VHVIRSSDVANAGLFTTDANGRQMLERTRNHRPTFDYNATEEPVASNMYPITSRMWIQDDATGARITVLNDRSQVSR
jgi:lysosomal alpha-mannosidase